MSTHIRSVADGYVDELAEHEPVAAQALGRAAGDRLPDFGPEWAQRRRELADETLAGVSAASDATPSDRSLRAALDERLRSDAALFDTGFTARLLAPLASPVHQLRESFDDITVTDDQEGDEAIERLAAVPAALGDLRRRLEWARAEGERGRFTGTGVVAARQVEAVADQVSSWVDPQGTAYFESIAHAGLTAERAARLERAQAAATVASSDFERFLRSDLLPTAPREDAVGEAVYAETARSFLGTPVDLDELYAFGWDELARLVEVSRSLAVAVGEESGSVAAAAHALNADPRYRVAGREAIVSWLRERLESTLSTVDGAAFDLPAEIREVDIVVPTAATGVVFYTPGAPDGSVRSKIVWTVPEGADSISTWQEVTSFHHEGVPGHHLEHTINRANTQLHPWQRYLCEIHGYAEGWAHYSEQLSDELGLLRDPAERLGMVLGRIWRTVRIVADIGLHTGRPPLPGPWAPDGSRVAEAAWTAGLARRLLTDLALVDPRTAGFEVDRYLGWPGQALSFTVGAKLWKEARAAAEADGSSAKDFHHRALAHGPMGLAPLRALLTSDERTRP